MPRHHWILFAIILGLAVLLSSGTNLTQAQTSGPQQWAIPKPTNQPPVHPKTPHQLLEDADDAAYGIGRVFLAFNDNSIVYVYVLEAEQVNKEKLEQALVKE